jgi:hypothetical protein
MVHHLGYLVVDKQDEVVEVDHWNIEQNQMINGIIMMIDLVDKKTSEYVYFEFLFLLKKQKGPSNSYESNQPRGWRSNTTMSDRDLNLRRPQAKRDRKIQVLFFQNNSGNNIFFDVGMPEWMDDNNDGDNQLSSATFEQDGTFTKSASLRQNSNEQQKYQTQSSTEETSSRGNVVSDENLW